MTETVHKTNYTKGLTQSVTQRQQNSKFIGRQMATSINHDERTHTNELTVTVYYIQ